MPVLPVTSRHAKWRLVLACLVLAVCGCEAGDDQGTPRSQSDRADTVAPDRSAEAVTRLPSKLTGPAQPIEGIAAQFPQQLALLPELEPRSTTAAVLTYRPRESPRDGNGWSSETIAVWDGKWSKISLGALGLPEELWPGADPMGVGALSDSGTRLAFSLSDGLVVLDLRTLEWVRLLEGEGRFGTVRWFPGEERLVADPWQGRDQEVNTRTGATRPARIPARAIGFNAEGQTTTVRHRDGEATIQVDGRTIARVPKSSFQRGNRFASWSTSDKTAYTNTRTVGGRYALRVVTTDTQHPTSTLRWTRRTGTFVIVHGWWDDQRLLVSLDGSVATWTPDTGELTRIAALPPSDFNLQHGAVGLGFAQQ